MTVGQMVLGEVADDLSDLLDGDRGLGED